MKKQILIAVALCISAFGYSQNEIFLQINQLLESEAFSMNTDATAPDGYNFKVQRLDYYVSGISINHDGGQNTSLPDTHILVKAQNNTNFSLGFHDIDQIESITFHIGVGPEYNHLDPSTYASNYPLAPQNPSMHWGWSSGYRFLAIEGYSGANNYDFEIHALGDDSYNSQTIEVTAADNGNTRGIVLNADYTKLLNNIDLSSGGVFHSTLLPETIEILENAATLVFSAGGVWLGLEKNFQEASLDIFPNPSFGNSSSLVYSDLKGDHSQVEIYDLSGKIVYQQQINAKYGRLVLPNLTAGAYLIKISGEDGAIHTRRWIQS